MLDERKSAILRAVVETYIETAEPVGSTAVADVAKLGVSSATIRNELVQLDQQGYLSQPHTSAGRIPTNKAYREFVDGIEEPAALRNHEFQRIKDFFDDTHGEIEEMLSHTSKLLSQMTGVASVVVAPDRLQATVRSVQLVQLGERTVLAVMVLSDGQVEKGTIEVSDLLAETDLAVANGHLSASMVGRTVLGSTEPTGSGNAAADRLVVAAREVLSADGDAAEMFIGGLSSLPNSFDAVDTIREVLSLLEKQLVVVTLMRDVIDRGLAVSIGNETGIDPLAECSLVVAPYSAEGQLSGTIGLLGPTRMNYPHAMAAVAVVSQALGKRLSEG